MYQPQRPTPWGPPLLVHFSAGNRHTGRCRQSAQRDKRGTRHNTSSQPAKIRTALSTSIWSNPAASPSHLLHHYIQLAVLPLPRHSLNLLLFFYIFTFYITINLRFNYHRWSLLTATTPCYTSSIRSFNCTLGQYQHHAQTLRQLSKHERYYRASYSELIIYEYISYDITAPSDHQPVTISHNGSRRGVNPATPYSPLRAYSSRLHESPQSA